MKKIKKLVIIAIVIYLIISAIYVLFHINFLEKSENVGMGYSETNNMLRLFMGIPKTLTTDKGVSPIFLIEVIVKFIISIALIIYIKNNNNNN